MHDFFSFIIMFCCLFLFLSVFVCLFLFVFCCLLFVFLLFLFCCCCLCLCFLLSMLLFVCVRFCQFVCFCREGVIYTLVWSNLQSSPVLFHTYRSLSIFKYITSKLWWTFETAFLLNNYVCHLYCLPPGQAVDVMLIRTMRLEPQVPYKSNLTFKAKPSNFFPLQTAPIFFLFQKHILDSNTLIFFTLAYPWKQKLV